MRSRHVGHILALALAAEVSCGRPASTPLAPQSGIVAGTVIGPVAGATVHVWRLDEHGRRAFDEGSATTAADGTFSVGVGAAQGPFLIVASGGSFTDPATGVVV